MASISTFVLIFSLLLLTTTTISTTTTTTTSENEQMSNIVDALVATGDFSNWASILSSADPSILPLTATIFIPSDADYDTVSASSHNNLSPFLLFPYHVIPQRLSFSDLLKFPPFTRLPTLLPGFSLLISNNSRNNFSVDGVNVTHPDLYQNAAVSAHGIEAPFDYTIFGDFDYKAVFGNTTVSQGSSGGGTQKNRSVDVQDSVEVSGVERLWAPFVGSKILVLGFVVSWV